MIPAQRVKFCEQSTGHRVVCHYWKQFFESLLVAGTDHDAGVIVAAGQFQGQRAPDALRRARDQRDRLRVVAHGYFQPV